MPIADMTGAAANRIGVARDLGRYNQGQKDQLLGGISAVGDLGAAAVEAQHRAKMEQMLQEQGFDPATAKNLIAAGPHATASALLQKKRDAQQREQQLSDVQSQRTWQETQTEGSRMFEQGQQDRQNAFSIQQRQTPTYGETQADAQRKAFQEALKGASAPAQQPFNLIGGPMPGATGMTVPVQPGEMDIRRSMQRQGFDYRPQPTENIDPLSPAGVKAQQDIIGVRPAPQGRESIEDAAKRTEAEEAARLKAQKAAGAGAFKPTADKPNWMDVKDYGGLIDLRNKLETAWGEAPTATMKAPIEEKLKVVNEQIAAARKAGGGDRTIGAGGSPAPAGGGIDPTLKAEFDGFPPERQKALLEQMTPDERAKVGR